MRLLRCAWLAFSLWFQTRGPWLDMVCIVLAVICILFLTGCDSTRETAKSTAMASIGVEASEIILTSPEVEQAIADPAIPEATRQAIQKAIGHVLELLAQSRRSMAPAINLLSSGQPIDTGTTAEQAAHEPKAFVSAAARQEGRAEAEVKSLLWWRSAGNFVLQMGGAIGGSLGSQLLLGVGGVGGLAAIGLSIARMLGQKNKVIGAMVDYAKDAADCDPETPEQLEAIKEEHAKRQKAAGIHSQVAAEIERRKRNPVMA